MVMLHPDWEAVSIMGEDGPLERGIMPPRQCPVDENMDFLCQQEVDIFFKEYIISNFEFNQ